LPTAVLYLVFSLPAFCMVPDPAVRERLLVALGVAYRDVVCAVRTLPTYAGVETFILVTVLYTDAANTAFTNMTLYGGWCLGWTARRCGICSCSRLSLQGSVGFRFLTDRIEPKRTLAGVILFWFPPDCGVRHARRALAARNDRGVLRTLLADREGLSRCRARAYSGDALHLRGGAVGYRISIGSLAVIIAAGHFFLLRVPDTRREGKVDEFAPLIRRPRERKMYAVKGNVREQSWLAAVR
jgi:hypothetical protein